MIDETLQEMPEWKPAVAAFLAANFTEGSVIEHAWFYEAFGVPQPDQAESYKEGERHKLRFVRLFEAFRGYLLEEHLLALRSVPGVGYDLVPAKERAPWALSEAESRVSHELRKANRRMAFTPLHELTDDERRRHTDAMVRLGMMRVAMKPKRQLPRPDAA
jgi:hypothetical protein